jgi:hypothetical protein
VRRLEIHSMIGVINSYVIQFRVDRTAFGLFQRNVYTKKKQVLLKRESTVLKFL